MSGKFMKILKIAIPTLTLVIIASQLLNSCAMSQSELLKMYERQQAIEIEVAYPENQEQGTEKELNWVELAFLDTYPEFRDIFDDTLGITIQGQNGKNGVVYVDLNSNHTNNSTLRYAFANAKFHSVFWNNTEAMEKLTEAAENIYSDISTPSMAKYAIINAYFNIFPDAEPNYFNGNQTLTRGEFLAGLFRAETPVSDLQSDYNFESAVDPAGTDPSTDFASQLQDYSYLTLEDQNLNSGTYQGTITRAEAVYTIVKLYYADEYSRTTGSESSYNDAKNAGDLALKAGFKVQDKETGAITSKNYWKSYELSYALQNADKGLPTDLYRALVVAKNHNLIIGSESRWDDGLTKSEAIQLITKVYESLGTYISADRGNSTGNVVNNETNQNNESTESGFNITEEDFHYTEDGKLEYTLELIEFVKSFGAFSSLDNPQIIKIIESQDFETLVNTGIFLGELEDYLSRKLSNPTMSSYLVRSNLGDNPTSQQPSDPAGNTGYGDTSKVEDSNKGGSDENEKTPENEQQGIDMSDKVDETTGQLKPTATPIPTDTPVDSGPDIIVETPEDKTPQFTYEKFYKTMYATDAVNLRQGPSTDFDKVGNLTKGQQVTVVGRCNETGWYMLADADTMAIVFVTDTYLSETPPATPTPAPTATPKPTEAPSQNTDSSSETTKPDGTKETQTIKFTYQGLDENNKTVTFEEELTVQGTYIDGYFIPDGLEEKVGYGFTTTDVNEYIAWITKYPNAECKMNHKKGIYTIYPAGYETQKGNYNGDGLMSH